MPEIENAKDLVDQMLTPNHISVAEIFFILSSTSVLGMGKLFIKLPVALAALNQYKMRYLLVAIPTSLAVMLYLISQSIFFYAIAAAFVLVSLFVPGYVILFQLTRLDASECVSASIGITALGYMLLGGLLGFIPSLQMFTPFILGTILVLSTTCFVRRKMYRDLNIADKYGLYLCLALWLLTLFLVSLPVPGFPPGPFNEKVQYFIRTLADDNFIPYRIAQFLANGMPIGKVEFLGEPWNNFFDRTPLMGAVSLVLLKGLNLPITLGFPSTAQDFAIPYRVFQVIGSLLNSTVLLGAYLFLKRLFGWYIAKISTSMLLINAFVLLDTVFTWPKCLVAYFALLSWYFLVRKQRLPVLAGLFAGLAYLSHDLGAIYAVGALLYTLYTNRSKLAVLGFALPLLALAVPWLILSYLASHQFSLFILYAMSVAGLPATRDYQPILFAFLATSPFRILWIRIVNLYLLLFPWPLGISDPSASYFNVVTALTFFPLAGAIGVFLFCFSYYGIARNFSSLRREIVAFLGVPLALMLFIQGWPGPSGLGAMHFAEAIVPLLTAFGVVVLARRKKLLMLVYLLQLIIFASILVLSYGHWFGPDWSSIDYVATGCMAAIIIVVCFSTFSTIFKVKMVSRP